MAVPIYKLMSLVIRVFSRPLVTYIKTSQIKNDGFSNHILKRVFVKLGNTHNYIQNWINRKFMNVETKFSQKPLNENLALEKGVQFLFEMLIYSLVIGVPLYEINKVYQTAQIKTDALNSKLKAMSDDLDSILQQKQNKIKLMNQQVLKLTQKNVSKNQEQSKDFVKLSQIVAPKNELNQQQQK